MLDPARMDDVLRRGGDVASLVAAWKSVDERRKSGQRDLDTLRAQRNAANERMSKLDKKSTEFTTARDELKSLSTRIKEGEAELAKLETTAQDQLLEIPNAPHASVPEGKDEHDNPVLHTWGTKPTYTFTPKAHWELGESLGILDFEAGTRITGGRFTVLRGAASKLTRGLISFMLDLHTQHGYEEIWPPAIVKRASLRGTGQLPKFEQDLFKLEIPRGPDHDPDNDLFLSPTAEVQVTNLFNDQIVDGDNLPIRYCAYTPCFRAEAGAAGKDTRGLIRQHQFDKVELVKLTTPDASYGELEALRQDAERVLQTLGLHYRVVTLCTGDLGFHSAKTYDLEVWLPGQDAYREISSCSNFEDYQARRAKIRYRPNAGDKPRAVHTINGSGIAIGRTLVAILEQYQQADGSVVVPSALRPYVGGVERIVARS
ncbi:MAG: serine--tRNA ligase [Deltaproteobacteria bacterium]|nr:serine--tRNA ligase [Deltaproteobacteria bacterium]